MQVPMFRAKDKDSDKVVEGFYFNYPVTNNATEESAILANTAHCIITHQVGMMGLINEPIACSIDMGTLEFVRFVDVPVTNDKIVIV
jgi:hypothetical protein